MNFPVNGSADKNHVVVKAIPTVSFSVKMKDNATLDNDCTTNATDIDHKSDNNGEMEIMYEDEETNHDDDMLTKNRLMSIEVSDIVDDIDSIDDSCSTRRAEVVDITDNRNNTCIVSNTVQPIAPIQEQSSKRRLSLSSKNRKVK